MRRNLIAVCVLSAGFVAGCEYLGLSAPDCAADSTLDLVREIIAENVLEKTGVPAKETLRKRLAFEYPRATKLEENIKKYSCEANLLVDANGGKSKIAIAYTSQAAGESHLVSVDGISVLDAALLKEVLSRPEVAMPPDAAAEASAKDDPAQNRTIEPGVSFGAVTSATSESDLIGIYGKENVRREAQPVGEGTFRTADVVFKGSESEFRVFWKNDDYKTPERVIVVGSAWSTPEGFRAGLTLDKLIEVNGRNFTFYGFDWDGSGLVESWERGRLSRFGDDLVVRLGRETKESADGTIDYVMRGDDALEDAVTGDKKVFSGVPGLATLQIKVYEIDVVLAGSRSKSSSEGELETAITVLDDSTASGPPDREPRVGAKNENGVFLYREIQEAPYSTDWYGTVIGDNSIDVTAVGKTMFEGRLILDCENHGARWNLGKDSVFSEELVPVEVSENALKLVCNFR